MQNNNLAVLLSLGLIGSNFGSLLLLSTRPGGSIPFNDLSRLATTENSSSQMRYTKEGEKLEVMVSHNMHSPKTVMFTTDKSTPKWHGKVATEFQHEEYIAHHPKRHGGLSAEQIQCYIEKGSASSKGEIFGTSVVTATPVASSLSGIPIIGWLAGALAVKKSAELGKQIGSDFVDDC